MDSDTFKITGWEMGRENARNHYGEKEQVNRIQVIAANPRLSELRGIYSDPIRDSVYIAKSRFITVCDARFWMGRSASASVVYCSVWIHTRDRKYSAGRGDAGGYGYHKESAALAEALESAGVRFKGHFGGMGESAMESALLAVARRAGFKAAGIM